MKTGVYFDKETFELINRFAKEKGISRSDAIRFCVRTVLQPGTFGI